MRLVKAALSLLLLLALAACGTPTDNSVTSNNENSSGQTGATASAAPVAASPMAASPAAAGGAAGGADTASRNNKYSAPPEQIIDPNKSYTAMIETTKGTMTAELYAKDAPITVNNFVFLSREGYYQNIRFHRIMKDFMVQTGDPLGTGTGGPGYTIKDEFNPKLLHSKAGMLSMAKTNAPDSGGSQFFITHTATPHLDGLHAVFGEVVEGLDVLDAIANTPVGPGGMGENSTPTEEVLITNITINEQ